MSAAFPQGTVGDAPWIREFGWRGRFGVVLHDAGAAAHVVAWLSENRCISRNFRVYAEGPALQLARAEGVETVASVSCALKNASWALVGTGWQTDLERNAMKLCAETGITCVAVIDHWVNYRERFANLADGERPDLIVVTDPIAEALAREQLTWAPVALWPNTLSERLKRALVAARKDQAEKNPYLLWLQEPIRSEDGSMSDPLVDTRYAPKIWQLLNEVMRDQSLTRLVVRSHPSQECVTYEANTPCVEVHDGSQVPLFQDLAGAAQCLGINTYALYLASLTGTTVASVASTIGLPSAIPDELVVGYSSPR